MVITEKGLPLREIPLSGEMSRSDKRVAVLAEKVGNPLADWSEGWYLQNVSYLCNHFLDNFS